MKNQRGFTLLELLIVLVLIAALFSAVTISTGTNNYRRTLVEEGERLKALFIEASQHAILYNKEVGWYTNEEEYGFVIFDYEANTWSAAESSMFRVRPMAFQLDLTELDGTPVAEQLDTIYKKTDQPDDEQTLPSLVFLSSGESSSFELSLYEKDDPDWTVGIKSQGFGEPELVLPYELEEDDL
jgi:general secretion pathway protein H